MSNFSCNCSCERGNCLTFAIIASVIIGVITAFLRITAVITLTPAFLWVLFGIAVVYLGITLFKSNNFQDCAQKECICPALSLLLAGILGTILTAVILLGITFAATSIIGAIITGVLLLFFSLIITSTACLVRCISKCNKDNTSIL